MNAFRRTRCGAIVLMMMVLIVAGCSSTASTGSGQSAVDTNATEADTTPALEGTGLESPQPTQNSEPSITLASLPVGGGAVGDASGAQQCVEVNWVGTKPIPSGISIQITGLATDPSGVFEIGGDACPSGRPQCNSWHWAQDNQDISCLVAGTQVADGDGDVILTVSATVQCPDQPTCASFQASVDGGPGSSVAFEARHENVSSSPAGPSTAGG